MLFPTGESLFETAFFVVGFRDNGGYGGRLAIFVQGYECDVGVADVMAFGLFQGGSRDLDTDFHGRAENPVDRGLYIQDGAHFGGVEKANSIDSHGGYPVGAMSAGGDASRLVQKTHQVATEGNPVGIGIAGMDNVVGDGGGFFDGLGCFFHACKYRFL